MENLSRSRHPNRGSATLSKKISNGNNNGGIFAPKTVYEDIRGGPPKSGVSSLSPRFEDYSEIFGSFHALRASSIPILDLPAVDEAEIFVDVRSSGFDYSEVFGGFYNPDFAVSYEELIDQSKDGGADDSSEEAWTPAGTESPSFESDGSGKNNRRVSNGDSSNLPFDGSTEFNISYNMANQQNEGEMLNGMTTHLTQVHEVPGFTYLVDEVTPFKKTEDDSYLNMDLSTGTVKGKNLRKTMSLPLNQTFENDLHHQKGYSRSVSHPNEGFVTVSDISLRTRPSKVPPPSRPPPLASVIKREDFNRVASSIKSASSEGSSGNSSPTFFDVEIDASSSAAAMKEVIEKAQAKLQSAKELMVKKTDNVHKNIKLGSDSSGNDRKDKGGNISKITDQSNNEQNEQVKGNCEIDRREIKLPVREGGQTVIKITEACPMSADDKLGKLDCASEWKEATCSFELVRADNPRRDFEPVNNENINFYEHGQNEKNISMEALEKQEESVKKVKEVRKSHELKEQMKIGNELNRQGEDGMKLKPAKDVRRQKDHEKSEVTENIRGLEENGMETGIAQPFALTKKKIAGANKSEKHEKLVGFKQREKKRGAEKPMPQKTDEQKKKEVDQIYDCYNIPKMSKGVAYDGKRQKDKAEHEETEKKLEEGVEREEYEKRLKEALEQEENEKRLKEAHAQEENDNRLKEALEREENLKRQQEASDREYERKLEEALEQEVYEQREKEARERERKERAPKLSCSLEDIRKRSKYSQYREACETIFEEVFEPVDIENASEDDILSAECEKKLQDIRERGEPKGTTQVHDGTKNNKNQMKVKLAVGAQQHMDTNQNYVATKFAFNHDEEMITMEASQEDFTCGESRETRTESRFDGRQSEAPAIETQGVHEKSNASGVCRVRLENDNNHINIEDANELPPMDAHTKKAGPGVSTVQKHSEVEAKTVEMADMLIDEDLKGSSNAWGEKKLEKEDAKELLPSDETEKKAVESKNGIGQATLGIMKSASKMESDPQHQERKFVHEREYLVSALSQEENKDKRMPNQGVKERVEKSSETGETQPVFSEGNQKGQKTSHPVRASEAAERKEKNLSEAAEGKEKNLSETLVSRRNENEKMISDKELENDHLRKLEEERERKREREKDRTAYVEARERAERAAAERVAAEARQRVMAEARERLEKACAEARENTLAGRPATEIRIKAERAAVERATAEARERAVEKAMAERAAFEARDRLERSVSDKFSASSRESGTRQSSSSSDLPNLQSQSGGVSSVLRYTYSSVCDERSEGVEGETAQRCKARLERYRRTAERAAKALAEKNMRDLLAQREQAERNRLAETLGADVKRWSSGKEGNLRALLSTLQYILGPDSGWQPIPLTEVITSAAVKKAYRKATLCVHPDKLQQRGASIQQKYICEKVFDLLKEAWNKFNSEER